MTDYTRIKEAVASNQPIPKDVIQTQSMTKNSSKYNTRVRQAISDEYVRCSKEMQSIRLKISEISERLVNEKGTLSYSEYLDLEAYKRNLINQLTELQVESNTWDKAREICLNIADDSLKKH